MTAIITPTPNGNGNGNGNGKLKVITAAAGILVILVAGIWQWTYEPKTQSIAEHAARAEVDRLRAWAEKEHARLDRRQREMEERVEKKLDYIVAKLDEME